MMGNNKLLVVSWLVLIEKTYEVMNIACDKIFIRNMNNDANLSNLLTDLLKVNKQITKSLNDLNEKLFLFQIFITTIFNYLTVLSNVYFILRHTVFEVHTTELPFRVFSIYFS